MFIFHNIINGLILTTAHLVPKLTPVYVSYLGSI